MHPTLAHILNRLRMATTVEERLEVFCDMKKTPYLMAAFIKLIDFKEVGLVMQLLFTNQTKTDLS